MEVTAAGAKMDSGGGTGEGREEPGTAVARAEVVRVGLPERVASCNTGGNTWMMVSVPPGK